MSKVKRKISICLLVCIGALGLLIGCESTPPAIKCVSDRDCQVGYTCQSGAEGTSAGLMAPAPPVCQGSNCTTPPVSGEGVCKRDPNVRTCFSDDECGQGEYCKKANSTPPITTCTTNTSGRKVCYSAQDKAPTPDGVCDKKVEPPTEPPKPPTNECETDSDCAFYQTCKSGTPNTCVTRADAKQCNSDTECGDGQFCKEAQDESGNDRALPAPAPCEPEPDSGNCGAPAPPPPTYKGYCATKEAPRTCKQDDNCTPNEFCDFTQGKRAPTPYPDPVPEEGVCTAKSCGSDKDCGTGQVCNKEGDGFRPAPTTGTCQMEKACVTYVNDKGQSCVKCGDTYLKCN